MTPATVEALRVARVPWVAGMATTFGDRCVAADEDTAWLCDGAPHAHEVEAWGDCGPLDSPTPDLDDRLTYLACLDELARRVGLDPVGGVLWQRTGRTEWRLRVVLPAGLQAGLPGMDEYERRLHAEPLNGPMRRLSRRPGSERLWLHSPSLAETTDPREALALALRDVAREEEG